MPDTWELQAERRRNERYYGPWERTREAILAAKGAREGVVKEAAEPELPFDADAINRYAFEANVCYDREVQMRAALAPVPAFFHRLLYGEPVDYSEDRLP